MKPLYALAALAPLSFAADELGWAWQPVVVLGIAALGLASLAELFGDAVEDLAVISGHTIGGLLTALLGSVPELIIAAIALDAGLLDLAKATITGSILGSLLLMLGLSPLRRRSSARAAILQPGRRIHRFHAHVPVGHRARGSVPFWDAGP